MLVGFLLNSVQIQSGQTLPYGRVSVRSGGLVRDLRNNPKIIVARRNECVNAKSPQLRLRNAVRNGYREAVAPGP